MIEKILYQILFKEEYLLKTILRSWGTGEPVDISISDFIRSNDINWHRFIKIAYRNKCEPYLLPITTSPLLANYVPKNIRQILKLIITNSNVHKDKQKKEYLKIIKIFNKRRINYVVMKSLGIQRNLYKDISLRRYDDIDFLIPIYDFKNAYESLLKNGFQHKGNIQYIDFYTPESQEVFKKGDVTVELHSKIIDGLYISKDIPISEKNIFAITQYSFQNSIYLRTDNTPIRVFNSTQLTINMFLHSLFQHNFQGLSSLFEWLLFVKKQNKEIDWKYLFKFIDQNKLSSFFTWYLEIIVKLFNNQLPQECRNYLKNHNIDMSLKKFLLSVYFEYKAFHPTNFLTNSKKEIEKKIIWSLIYSNPFRVIKSKFLRSGQDVR